MDSTAGPGAHSRGNPSLATLLLPGSAWPSGRLRTAGRLSRPRPKLWTLPCVAGRLPACAGPRLCLCSRWWPALSPGTCGRAHVGFLSQATPVSSLPVCPWDAMLGRLGRVLGTSGLTSVTASGCSWLGASGHRAVAALSWAQGSEYLRRAPGRLVAFTFLLPLIPTRTHAPSGQRRLFASEAVTRQPRPWVHRGGWQRPGGLEAAALG